MPVLPPVTNAIFPSSFPHKILQNAYLALASAAAEQNSETNLLQNEDIPEVRSAVERTRTVCDRLLKKANNSGNEFFLILKKETVARIRKIINWELGISLSNT